MEHINCNLVHTLKTLARSSELVPLSTNPIYTVLHSSSSWFLEAFPPFLPFLCLCTTRPFSTLTARPALADDGRDLQTNGRQFNKNGINKHRTRYLAFDGLPSPIELFRLLDLLFFLLSVPLCLSPPPVEVILSDFFLT